MATKLNRNQIGGYINTRGTCSIFTFETTKLKVSDIEQLGFLDTAFDMFKVGDIIKIFIKTTEDTLTAIYEYVIIKKDLANKKVYKHKLNSHTFKDYAKDNKLPEVEQSK